MGSPQDAVPFEPIAGEIAGSQQHSLQHRCEEVSCGSTAFGHRGFATLEGVCVELDGPALPVCAVYGRAGTPVKEDSQGDDTEVDEQETPGKQVVEVVDT